MYEDEEPIGSFYKLISFKKHILNAHIIYYHFYIVYPLFVIITLILLFVYKFIVKKDDIINKIQNENGEWLYKCNIDTLYLIYNSCEWIIIAVILLKGKYVFSMDCIFNVTRYITYSSILAIVFGPLIPVR